MLATGAVVAITLGVSVLGDLQASRLGSALYEIGAVRLPSVLGLNMIQSAKTRLNGSARIMSLPGIGDTTIAAELLQQSHAWELAERGWTIYAHLPQTAEEAAAWNAFVPAWKAWKDANSAIDSSIVRSQRMGETPASSGTFQELRFAVARQSVDLDSLLAKLTGIQYDVANVVKIRSVYSYGDFADLWTLMLMAVLISVIGWLLLTGRKMSRTLTEVATSLSRIAHGDWDTPLIIRSTDELGEIAAAVNTMMQTHRTTEGERAAADDARTKSEEKFSKVFMSAPVCILVSDLTSGLILEANDEFLRILGFRRDEVIGHSFAELGVWPDLGARDALLARITAYGASSDDEFQCKSRDGRILACRASVCTFSLGGTSNLVSAFIDITDRTRAEDLRKKSEETFSRAFMAAPVGISITGLHDGRILESNDEFLRILGYERDEVIGRTTMELAIWVDPTAREGLVEHMRSNKTLSSELQLRAKNGEYRIVRAATQIIEIEDNRHLLTTVADLTDQRLAEAEGRHSEQLYRELVNGVPDVIVATTPEGILTALNPAFEFYTGRSRAAWIGKSFVGLMLPDDVPLALALFQAVLQREPRPVTLLRFLTADGRVRIMEINLSTQRRHDRVVGILGIARDVTDRVQLEEEFRQAQKMEAVGRLAGGIAHDFNNVLTIISGYSGELLEKLDAADPKRADMEGILGASTTATTLTRQLLAFSRRQVFETKMLRLNDVVTSSERLLKRLIGEDVQLVIRLAKDAGNICADAGEIEQTIMNLAINARDAMPKGGTLTITTANIYLSNEQVRGHPDASPGRYAMLAVSDTGIGMDDVTKDRLFDPFFTTKEIGKGTGLGLSTVFGIVKRSKGLITVNSEPGRGATFEIYIPLGDEVTTPTIAASTEPVSGTETVLVVEDEPAVRAIVRRGLEHRGYTVLQAQDGQSALMVASQHEGPIHIVLTDMVMLGMNGREVAKQLIAQRSDLRVLFMSGYTGNVEMDRAIAEYDAGFLQKPFTSDELARKVRDVLNKPRDP